MAPHRVCRVEELPVGARKIVKLGRASVGVFNVDGEYHAIRNICPHHGAPLCLGDIRGTMLPSDPGVWEYGLDNRFITCPWHRWEFDLTTGRSFTDPEHVRVKVYPVRVEDGHVVVDA